MDDSARAVVDEEWADRFGLSVDALRTPGVLVAATDVGRNAAMTFRFADTVVVAVPAAATDRAVAAIAGRARDDVFTAGFLHAFVGPSAIVEGPSWHGYATAASFRGRDHPAVADVEVDDAALSAFLAACPPDDVAESGFAGIEDDAVATAHVLVHGGAVVAAANLTTWREGPADVGLLAHPAHRGRGHGARLAGAVTARALRATGVVRYRALAANAPSLAIAARLGFEQHGANFRARRPG